MPIHHKTASIVMEYKYRKNGASSSDFYQFQDNGDFSIRYSNFSNVLFFLTLSYFILVRVQEVSMLDSSKMGQTEMKLRSFSFA